MIAGTAFDIVDVDQAWPRLRDRLARCGSDACVLQDTRERCLTGDALCMQSPDGVVIMSARGLAGGGVEAQVLLAVSSGHPGAFRRQEGAMLAIARDLGASVLSFATDRRGWARMLGPAWHEHAGTFSRST